jgi:hypothetical protein
MMNYKIVIYIVATFFLCCGNFNQPPLSNNTYSGKEHLKAITEIDMKSFYNKPIGLLLNDKVFEGYKYKRFTTEPVGCLSHLYLGYSYPDTAFNISIYPEKLKYMEQCIDFPHEKWDFIEFEKEILYKVEIW